MSVHIHILISPCLETSLPARKGIPTGFPPSFFSERGMQMASLCMERVNRRGLVTPAGTLLPRATRRRVSDRSHPYLYRLSCRQCIRRIPLHGSHHSREAPHHALG